MLVPSTAVHEVLLQLIYKSAVSVWSSKYKCAVNVRFSRLKCCACLAREVYVFVACATHPDVAESCQTCLTLQLGLLVAYAVH